MPASRGLGRPYAVIARTILVFFIIQFLVYLGSLFIYSAWANAHGHHYTFDQAASNLNGLINKSVPIEFLTIMASEGGIVLLVWLLLKRQKLGFGSIGLGRMPHWDDVKQAVLGAFSYYILFIVFGTIAIWLLPQVNTNQEQDIGFTNLTSGLSMAVAFISLVVLPPIGEEILMRGYLYSGLRKHWNFISSAVVTSLLFGAAHLLTGVGPGLLWVAGIQTFILSMVLVALREKTGALYSGILVHAANNAIAFFVHFHP